MALTAIERKRVEDAVDTLARYNKNPFINSFLKEQPKPRIPVAKYDKEELCDIVKQVLLGEYHGKKKYKLNLEDLITYLDRLQETGRQHLYLFTLPEEDRESLVRLRNETEVKTLLNCGDDICGEGKLIWETSDGPQLAQVRYGNSSTNQSATLSLKWIETRAFWAALQAPTGSPDVETSDELTETNAVAQSEDDESQRIQVRVKREERAASFFVIDLANGACELRIQAIHGRARLARQSQVNTYRTLIKHHFGFELVGPTVLAPAVRRALTTREVNIVSCSAILPDGGRFIGGRGEFPPVDVRKLQAGVTMAFEWSQRGAGVSRIELDGRLDEILILRPLLPEQHGLLVERVRRWRREGLAVVTVPGKDDANQRGTGFEPIVENGNSEIESQSSPMTRDDWISIIKTALRDRDVAESTSSPVELGIDRAIREYVRTHAMEETTSTSLPEGQIAPSDLVPKIVAIEDSRPLEQFLSYIEEVAKSERRSYQREITLIRNEELWYFRLFVIAAALALSIVATGAFLIVFIPAKLTVGTLTALLGAVTGRGTVLIRSYAKNLRTRRELIQDQQRDSRQTLIAIQTALSISDPEMRSAAMTSAASALLERIANPTRSTLPAAG